MKASILIDALKKLNEATIEARDHFVQTGEGLSKYRDLLFVTTEFETHVKAKLREIEVEIEA